MKHEKRSSLDRKGVVGRELLSEGALVPDCYIQQTSRVGSLLRQEGTLEGARDARWKMERLLWLVYR